MLLVNLKTWPAPDRGNTLLCTAHDLHAGSARLRFRVQTIYGPCGGSSSHVSELLGEVFSLRRVTLLRMHNYEHCQRDTPRKHVNGTDIGQILQFG